VEKNKPLERNSLGVDEVADDLRTRPQSVGRGPKMSYKDVQNEKPTQFLERALGSDEILRSLLIAATALTPDSNNRHGLYHRYYK
jgi:hypothetical protein